MSEESRFAPEIIMFFANQSQIVKQANKHMNTYCIAAPVAAVVGITGLWGLCMGVWGMGRPGLPLLSSY